LKPALAVSGGIVALALIGAGVFIGWLSATEYMPAAVEDARLSGKGARKARRGETIRVVSWNIGYAGLDAGADFFMDGGRGVRPAGAAVVKANLEGIRATLAGLDAGIVFLQEVDLKAKRSYGIDETVFLADGRGGTAAFARNFKTRLVPVPLRDMIGDVDSGLLTLNKFAVNGALRVSLPSPFRWPVRLANFKRCLLVGRAPVAGTGRELVLVNLHLEAYSSGASRDAQMEALAAFLRAEYEKGNYCVAGGDFNQNFPGLDPERFRLKDRRHFTPGIIDVSLFPAPWSIACDTGTPSSRLNDRPYDPGSADAQHYVIDGFILSPNVRLLSVKTLDAAFRYSDHNPVTLEIALE